ncbi:SDR family NAD(P)-dependent oxidoreductase [Egibacter rhizosphaerae]|uniref:SDR family NAD(P)-dependent oxidoreductase n=1 Tax=Egibacter rhizosphaerae TaxID=1670831 RepID=A0A411YKA3_9ACTN|nr:SDR family NAD(P)-dependent oxidoreductase [Egibacter rhizosphaerae]QBI21617.1 SDR family NAD(P)-dependent oxidoreductase [Egibacter rhizosphaerae]
MSDAIVWMTGASAGIGAAMAARIPFPARVIDISRSGGTPGTEHLPADLADPASWDTVGTRMLEVLEDSEADRVAFVQCAGLLEPIGFAGEVDHHAYAQNVVVNAAAPQVLGHRFLAALRESGFRGRADLAILTSGAAQKPYPGWSSYSAGKAAVNAWVIAAGQEQEQRGGRCTVRAIGPGVVATAMQEKIRRASEDEFPAVDKFQALYDEGKLSDPNDAADQVWRLIEDPGFGNGAVLDVRDLS